MFYGTALLFFSNLIHVIGLFVKLSDATDNEKYLGPVLVLGLLNPA